MIMVTMQDGVNIQGLRELYNEYDLAKGFFDYISTRSRNSWETSVDRLQHLLGSRGLECSRSDLVWLLKQLDQLNVGTFIVGRHGQRSRFQWDTAMISVGKAAAGEDVEVEGLNEDDANLSEDDEEVALRDGYLRHTFKLRPNVEITLDLPSDFSSSEANRLAGYVRTLPFEDA